jgi:hypothetical protein
MGWIARSLALGHWFSSPSFPSTGPTALVPPLFPYLLASVFRTFGLYTAKSAFVILSLDSLLSALTCIPIYLSLKYAAGEKPDLPPWYVVYQQMQRWLRAGCFELLVEDVRSLLRERGGRKSQPTAVVIDSRTLSIDAGIESAGGL